MVFESYLDQERHLVSIDCAIFGYHEGELKLLLFRREKEPELGRWSLIGGWVNADESAEMAAKRVLHRITGLNDIFMEQVATFSEPTRDPGGRVISIVYYSLVLLDPKRLQLSPKFNAQWCPITALPELIFDHYDMFLKALTKMRQKATYHLVGRELLPTYFTLTQLRSLYNSIFDKEFDPGNFRKKILSLNQIERLELKDTSLSRKGAYYYKFSDNVESTDERVI